MNDDIWTSIRAGLRTKKALVRDNDNLARHYNRLVRERDGSLAELARLRLILIDGLGEIDMAARAPRVPFKIKGIITAAVDRIIFTARIPGLFRGEAGAAIEAGQAVKFVNDRILPV